jgi:RHH-type proline utilization regulon transcriptional repressor/proline dehydrogenase/delta 1-pyrroline-5-carboxylate dehydrogenase
MRPGENESVDPEQMNRLLAALASYEKEFRDEFGVEHDHFHLLGQDNVRRYLAVRDARVRVHPDDSFFEVFARVCAAKIAGCRVTVSVPPGPALPHAELLEELTESWAGGIEFVEEDDARLAEAIRMRQTDRVRFAARNRVPSMVWTAAAEEGLCLVTAPVLTEGRVELLWYLEEQSLSVNYHRYGNLGARAGEPRAEPA